MTNLARRGDLLEAELYRFYVDFARPETGERGTLTALWTELQKLIREGWQLHSSSNRSPADKAGIDFIWTHPRKGWFALDAKATGVPCSCLIHLVPVGNSSESGEMGRLRFDDKKAFIELLVTLGSSGKPFDHAVLMAPKSSDVPAGALLEHLKDFQKALNQASKSTDDERYSYWADALKKAIGFAIAQNRPAELTAGDSERVQGIIRQALQEFMTAFFDPKNPLLEKCMRQQVQLHRSKQLLYVLSEDSIKVAVGPSRRLVVLSGLARVVRKRYEDVYKAKLAKHSSAEWLILRRRVFEAKGVDCAIHAILDCLDNSQDTLAKAA
jgi:hypothetical protein